jgi:subtilisin family serine protease/Tol biopolymer transport system component
MNCRNCGTHNDDHSKFCLKCGKPLPRVNHIEPKKPFGLPLPLLLIGYFIIIVLILFVGYEFLQTKNIQSKTNLPASQRNCILTTSLLTGADETRKTDHVVPYITEDSGGCLKFVGDTIHFYMNAGETGGVAKVDIGDVHKGLQLYDDGTHGDRKPGDGMYELVYTTSPKDVARNVKLIGKYTSVKDQSASEFYSQTSITIVNWQSRESSIDSKAEFIEDKVTGDIYFKDRLVVGFKQGTSQESIINCFTKNDLKVASWIPDRLLFEIELDSTQNYEIVKSQLISVPAVLGVDRNYAVDLLDSPVQINDNRLPIDQSNYLNVIRAKLGWKINQGDNGVFVATIDSGVAGNHPDLQNKLVHCNPNSCNNDNSDNSHGTMIAGIIAAEKGKFGVSGIAPGVKLISAACTWDQIHDKCGGSLEATERIYETANLGARVISLSFTTWDVFYLRDAIKYVYDLQNVVIVAGVGEDPKGGRQFFKDMQSGDHKVYPASYYEVIAVGASETDDSVAYYSDYGDQVIFAPVPSENKRGILSTVKTGGYDWGAGTSYAAPQVAALAALIISQNPNISNLDVINIIKNTADKEVTPGLGRINVYRALMVASGQDDPGFDALPMPITGLTVSVDQSEPLSVVLTWTPPAEDYDGVHIYRKNVADESIVQLEGGMIKGISSNGQVSYKDQYIDEGSTYQYFVFSVDTRGQESVDFQQSEEILVQRQPEVTGTWIGYVGPDENVWLIHPDGTEPTQLTFDGVAGQSYWDPIVGYRNIKWSPDGSMLGMLRVDKYGTRIQAISILDKKVIKFQTNTEGSFDWLPDSQSIIFSDVPFEDINERGQRPGGLSIIEINTGKITSFLDAGTGLRYTNPNWSPEGGNIFFNITTASIGPMGMSPYELGFANSSGVITHKISNDGNCSWSPDGEKLVCSNHFGEQPTSDLVIFSNTGSKLSEITNTKCCGFMDPPDWSPDGNWIVFNDSSTDVRFGTIYIVKPDGSNLTNLVRNLPGTGSPRWSPDGKTIAVLSGAKGSVNVNIMNPDGTGLKPVTNVSGDVRMFAWQPMSLSESFPPLPTTTPTLVPPPTISSSGLITYIGTDKNIWIVSPDGSGKRPITTNGNYSEPQWSPDNSSIVFVQTISTPNGNQVQQIGVISINDSSERIVVSPEKTPFILVGNYYRFTNPRWSTDGKYIYFIASDGRVQGDNVRKVDVASGQNEANFTQFFSRGFDILANSQAIVSKDFSNLEPVGDGLYLYNSSGSRIGTILPTQQGGIYNFPSGIPNSQQIAFINYEDETKTYSLDSINQDGSNRSTLFSSSNLILLSYSWSPEVNMVAVDTNGTIQLIDLRTKTSQLLVDGTFPDWSNP